MLDALISPSNVRNFEEAISGELVSIPSMIKRRISAIHEGASTCLKNLGELEAVLSVKRDEVERWFKRVRGEFSGLASALGIPVKCFDRGPKELERIREMIKRELEEAPARAERLAEVSGRLESKEFEHKFEAVRFAQAVFSERESVRSMIGKLEEVRGKEKLLSKWSEDFGRLPPVTRPQELGSFQVPTVAGVDFSVFPQGVSEIFSSIRGAKRELSNAERVCSRFGIRAEFEELKKRIKVYRRLLEAIEHPSERAEGIQAIVFEEEGKGVVSIPLEQAVENPLLFLELQPVPRVHVQKGWEPGRFKREIKKYSDEVRRIVFELRDARNSLSRVRSLLAETKRMAGILQTARSSSEAEVERIERSIGEVYVRIGRACEGLKLFDIKPPEKLDVDRIAEGYDFLALGIENAEKRLIKEVGDLLEEFPEFSGRIKKTGIEGIENLKALLAHEREKLLEVTEKRRRMLGWIDLNIEAFARNWSMAETIEMLASVVNVSGRILQRLVELTDLDKIVEQISMEIEQGVSEIYSSVLGEPRFKFTHVGGGEFVSTVDSVPVSHPGGSEKAVLSMGIMATLARCFGLPLILDEALDRIDAVKVAPLLEYVSGLSSSIQVTLVACRSFNIEKNPELPPILETWRIHKVSKKRLEKVIEPVEPSLIIQVT